MKNEIINLIKDNEEVFENAFLMKFPSDEELADAEKNLGFKIPEEYVWFLQTYGHGGMDFDFLGYGLNGNAIFVNKTLHEREYGLPTDLLVIEDLGEYVKCIDTTNGKVVSWSKNDKDGVIDVADSFYEYFIEMIHNAIDNFDL